MGAAFLFGTTFLVVKEAVARSEPVPFLAVRFLVAAAVLWPLARRLPARRGEWRDGAMAAAALAAGYLLQTAGLRSAWSCSPAPARPASVGVSCSPCCAVAFAAHIVVLAHVAPGHDPVRLTFVQVALVGGWP